MDILARVKRYFAVAALRYPRVLRLRHGYVVQRNRLLRSIYALPPLNERAVFFESYNGASFACSPKAIYQAMVSDERFRDFTFIWAFREPERYRWMSSDRRTRLVRYKSLAYFRVLAATRYWVVNAMLPLEVVKRDRQVLVQCWHGTPLKRLRNDILESAVGDANSPQNIAFANRMDTSRYDVLLSPSRFASEKFASAFALPELGKQGVLLETGYPRNDFLFSYTPNDVDRIKRELGLPENRKVVLYAPTFRDDQYTLRDEYVYRTQIDFDYLQRWLGEAYVVLFRAHYMVADRFDFGRYRNFIYNVTRVDDANELYIVSDVLVTDYSSAFFDYAILDRPIVFYMYDRDHYRDRLRGFYLDLSELPGEVVTKEPDLVSRLMALEAYAERTANLRARAREKFNYLDSAHSSQSVIERVFVDAVLGKT